MTRSGGSEPSGVDPERSQLVTDGPSQSHAQRSRGPARRRRAYAPAVAPGWQSDLVKLVRAVVQQPPRVVRARTSPTRRARRSPAPRAGRELVYAPQLDGRADPGEVVWTWVPYEEDASQGKDRPVLVVGRDGRTLLGLMLSSQDERDGQRGWLALGPGAWDREQRPSWVRLDRVLEVAEDGIRREGAVLDPRRFALVADALRRDQGWA